MTCRVATWIGPDWAKTCWDRNECTIVKARNGYAVMDHSIQSSIAQGTKEECEHFLKHYQHWPINS